jgi:hypothetical protein
MLRDNLAGLIEPMLSSAGTYSLALCTHPNESSDDRPQNALKIPARQGGIYTLPENVASPFHAEPAQLAFVRQPNRAKYIFAYSLFFLIMYVLGL